MVNFFERVSSLASAFISAAGLSVFSVLFCVFIGFFEGFSSEQWVFWLWFAALWPFGMLAIMATYLFVSRNDERTSR